MSDILAVQDLEERLSEPTSGVVDALREMPGDILLLGVGGKMGPTLARMARANAAFFDAANGFAGCIAGLHEVLRRQGLLEGLWRLDPHETLGPGQLEEIDRVYRAYPHLNDDEFVAAHRDEWTR
jgi:hypothetical protein